MNKMLDEHVHALINASLCSIASGPSYTYTSGGNSTTIDYIISNSDAFRGISSCSTLEEHALNTSDHLSITFSLNLTHIRAPPSPIIPSSDIDWSRAVKEGNILLYSKACDEAVRIFTIERLLINWRIKSGHHFNSTKSTFLCKHAHTCKEEELSLGTHRRSMIVSFPICVGRAGVLLEGGKMLTDQEEMKTMMKGENAKEMCSNIWIRKGAYWRGETRHVQGMNPHCFRSTTVCKHIPDKILVDKYSHHRSKLCPVYLGRTLWITKQISNIIRCSSNRDSD